MDCCGGANHEITLRAGASTLTLARCGQCSHQTWTIDGAAVDREQAFLHLSGAYQGVPRAARAANVKTQAEREARRVQREAAANAPEEIRLPAEPVPSELTVLLEGWQVLGATA